MKHRLRIALAAMMLLAGGGATAQGAHAYLPVSQVPQAVFLVDTATIDAAHSGNTQAWVLIVMTPIRQMQVGAVSYALQQRRFDCAARSWAKRALAEYDDAGNVLAQSAYSDVLAPAGQGSVDAAVLDAVCGGWKASALPPSPDLQTAVAAARAAAQAH